MCAQLSPAPTRTLASVSHVPFRSHAKQCPTAAITVPNRTRPHTHNRVDKCTTPNSRTPSLTPTIFLASSSVASRSPSSRHYRTHTLTSTLSHPHSRIHKLAYTFSYSQNRFHTLASTLTHLHSLIHTLAPTLSHSHSRIHTLYNPHPRIHTHASSFSHRHSRIHTLAPTLPHPHSLCLFRFQVAVIKFAMSDLGIATGHSAELNDKCIQCRLQHHTRHSHFRYAPPCTT